MLRVVGSLARAGHDERDRRDLDLVEAELRDEGRIEFVASEPEERTAWHAFDLASLIEGCFHEVVDPGTLDETASGHWQGRLGEYFAPPSLDSWDAALGGHERRYWLLDGGRRAGTVCLERSHFFGPWLHVRSLYVLPEHRRRGLAGAALARLARGAARRDLLGIRLSTSWTWQQSLRFYLARGFWLRLWKHDLQLVLEPHLPDRRFTVDGDTASLDVLLQGKPHRLLSARRDGDCLVIEERPRVSGLHENVECYAMGTFAVLLAISGWPLVRGEDHWARRYYSSDFGEPEGLAYKIGVFEDVARENGWVVDTVSIPGLEHWQVWARGQLYGRTEQQVRDIEAVARRRGWRVERELLEAVSKAEQFFAMDQLLTSAATAASFEEWTQEAERLIGRKR